MTTMSGLFCARWVAAVLLVSCAQAQAQAVYRCPGNLYTDQLSAKEALDKGCKALDGSPITVIQGPARRDNAKPSAAGSVPAAPASGVREARVDPAEQKARDSDARRILEAELRKEQERLAALRKEYNLGQPERLGDERNYQKYLDRVEGLKAAVARKEADVAAIKRELAKLGS
jgi:hypothetical protein